LPPPAVTPNRLAHELREFERQCLLETLERFGGHQGKTAVHLGISRRTLTNKLNELDLPRPRKGKRVRQ
jgi:DNA-binding NtrC family response regulator